jgi:hypothetical protein
MTTTKLAHNEDLAIAIANNLGKKLVVMVSFCRQQQWESGAHRLAYNTVLPVPTFQPPFKLCVITVLPVPTFNPLSSRV